MNKLASLSRTWLRSTCLRHARPSCTNPWFTRKYSEASILSPLTEIEKIMVNSVKATGPISFSTYMQLCLSHPTYGYYMRQSNAVFGARGDFITSPEISQVFGELMAVWLLSRWESAAPASDFRIVEIGPGRGTLMDDFLRVVLQFPQMRAKLKHVHLVETSFSMRVLQESKLQPLCKQHGWEILWHDSLADVPQDMGEYTMLVAHEFFDALPVHVIEKTNQGWHEVLIDMEQGPVQRYTLDSSSSPPTFSPLSSIPSTSLPSSSLTLKSPRWKAVLSRTPTASSTLLGHSSSRFNALPTGTRIEVSASSMKAARQIGELVSSPAGGAALIVDYGGEKAFGSSLRAFKNHEIVDIFHRPGECDVTANVDFAFLKESMGGLATLNLHGPLPQHTFLSRLGLSVRLNALMRSASPERAAAIAEAGRRLVDKTGMGGQYWVLGVSGRPFGSEDKVDGEEVVWPFVTIPES